MINSGERREMATGTQKGEGMKQRSTLIYRGKEN